MLNIKEEIVKIISQIELEESKNQHTPVVLQKLLEAQFWYSLHISAHQKGVNKAMGISQNMDAP